MNATTEISNSQDIIDIRDVIARVEELREELAGDPSDEIQEAREELKTLEALLAECCGNGGDEQWEGEWYPVTLIRDSYFEDYARELADDIGATDKEASWPHTCIDWEKAAEELQQDYTSVDFGGVDYWVR